MANTKRFLSCDWGTTAFRLWLVEEKSYKIIAEVNSKQGNAAIYEEWCKSGRPQDQRVAFYQSILRENIQKLEAENTGSLDHIPVIISGMASSTIGMMDVPYKYLPFSLDGSDLGTKLIQPSDDFPHPTLLISGARTADDVMRGEETQIVGCAIADNHEEQLVIHPGTHSKHIMVKNGQAVSFQTFMTGELFSLLSTKSILAASVEENQEFNGDSQQHFEQGVKDGSAQNLLHSLFLVRTGGLFKKRSNKENYYYLSGLLIGSELAAFPSGFTGTIILAGDSRLLQKYKMVMNVLGITRRVKELIEKEADDITIAGQHAVYIRRRQH